MVSRYETDLKLRMRKLGRTALITLALGTLAAWKLHQHHHLTSSLLAAIITVQVVGGSLIMRNDTWRDLRAVRNKTFSN
jgi:hypothetical protein